MLDNSICCYLLIINNLFPDAKIPENIPQYLISRNFSDDGAEVVDGFADVLGSEVGRDAGGKAVTHAKEGSAGVGEGLGVALICHQCRVAVGHQIALSLRASPSS